MQRLLVRGFQPPRRHAGPNAWSTVEWGPRGAQLQSAAGAEAAPPGGMLLARWRHTLAAGPVLVRDHIARVLYGEGGYFLRQDSPVGRLPRPLDFPSLLGEAGYRYKTQQMYRQLQVSWLTPAELFRPHYGRAVARALLKVHDALQTHPPQQTQQQPPQQAQQAQQGREGRAQEPLVIYEIGGGSGRLARDVLDYIRKARPDVYPSMRYVCVEISPRLAEMQWQTVQQQQCEDGNVHVTDGGGSSSGNGGSGGNGSSSSGSSGGEVTACSSSSSSTCSTYGSGGSSTSTSSSSSGDSDTARSRGSSSSSVGGGSGGGGSGSRYIWTCVEGEGEGGTEHGPHFQVQCRDARDLEGWKWGRAAAALQLLREGHGGDGGDGGDGGEEEHAFVLMTEVLDNLPHDRVQRASHTEGWQETWVEEIQGAGGEAKGWKEQLRPLQDPTILECLRVVNLDPPYRSPFRRLLDWVHGAPGHSGPPLVAWLPTGCLQLLKSLRSALNGGHTLLAADFDSLLGVEVEGLGAPLVADTVAGEARDSPSYLVPRGSSDIFFPTDFSNLARLFRHVAKQPTPLTHVAKESQRRQPFRRPGDCGVSEAPAGVTWSKTREFMALHAEGGGRTCVTAGGYNPLLEDFENTSVFMGTTNSACSICGCC